MSFIGSKEPSIKLLRSAELQRTNFLVSAFEIGHLFSSNINYNINTLLPLRVETHYILPYLTSAACTGNRNENNSE